ncbi:MAG: response regulator [Verrucomicrobia bacterium]|nr:response regulator [Verrucomicrobiota bacterium]
MKSSPSDDARCPTPKRPLRILVVEDHADTRQSLALFLGVLGHQARFAQGLQEALALAAVEEPFDLLLSDLQLPDGDGWELLLRLREANRAPAWAIAISGWGSHQAKARSQAAGFRAHLVKPAPPQVLATVLREAAEGIQTAQSPHRCENRG